MAFLINIKLLNMKNCFVNSYLHYLFFLIIFTQLILTQNFVDGVLAVVGNRSILHSEILQQSQIIALNQGLDPVNNSYGFQKIY